MPTPQEAYSAAIVRACEAHLARVKAARDTRHLAVSMVAVFGGRIAGLTERAALSMPRLERHMTRRYARRKRSA